LQAQLQSLLQQTWTNIEIVISDDHSTDGTVAMLKEYEGDPRFHIFFQQENLGPVKNFDFVIRQAKGEFMAFCDQDDIWLPEKISTLLSEIGDAPLVYCDSVLIDEHGQSLQKKLSDLRNMYSGGDTRGFVFSNVVWGHAAMIRRGLVENALPIPVGVPHDIWFAVKAAVAGGIKYVDRPLTLYRQHPKTVTTTLAQKTTARKREKRFDDFQDKLRWIGLLRDNAGAGRSFFETLFRLYSRKQQGNFVWPLFFFLLAHQKELFRFTRKSFLSRLTEIRKHSSCETL
jgi:glycosyltransferase involved in cell wall biosynthesis